MKRGKAGVRYGSPRQLYYYGNQSDVGGLENSVCMAEGLLGWMDMCVCVCVCVCNFPNEGTVVMIMVMVWYYER